MKIYLLMTSLLLTFMAIYYYLQDDLLSAIFCSIWVFINIYLSEEKR